MKIKTMTFNLRFRNEADGINVFDNRLPRIIEVIKNEKPDLIGFQEATTEMKNILSGEIADEYVTVGCGRKSTYRGESVSIAYRRDLFELVKLDTFWLSDRPEVAGSRYEDSDQSFCPRLCVCAKLSPEGYDGLISFYNTHLDHKGNMAQILEIEQISKKIKEEKGIFILTGDMNAKPDSECMRIIKSVDGIVDATANLTHTFHNFGRIDSGCKIDYIYTNAKTDGARTVEDIPVDGIYISDHYPVWAEIEI